MDEPLTTSTNKLTERAGYIATLGGIAVFLSLLILFPEPIRHYTARVVIEQNAVGSPTILQLPLNRSHAERAIQNSIQEAKLNQLLISQPQTDVQEEMLASGKVRLTVFCRERYASQTLQLLEQMTQNLVDLQPTSFQPEAINQKSEEEDILRRRTLAQEAALSVDDALNHLHQDHVTKSLALMMQISRQQSEQTQSEPATASEWKHAQEKLQALEIKRNELLTTRTEIHPLVQEVDFQLQQVRELLQSLPPPETKPVENKPNLAEQALQQLNSLQKEYELQILELRTQKQQAHERHAALERELLKLAQPLPSVPLKTSVVETPHLINKAEGGSGMWRIAMLLLTAGLAAGGIYRLVSKWPLASVIEHVDQVKRDLGLSVVSTPTLRRRPHVHEKQKQVLKNAVMAVEMVVVVLALSLFYAIGTSKQLVSEPLADPFGAVAEALDQASEPTKFR